MYLDNFRIYITEACNAKCSNCFNRENRNNQYMDIDHFSQLCKFLSKNGCHQIKIMGGEPTIHPLFSEFMMIAQEHFEVVSLFTNAISGSLFGFTPRESDIITYNFKFSRLLNKKRLLLDYPGIRNLEIQITSAIVKEKLLDEIIRVTSLAPDRIRPCFTLDCTADIFSDKNAIVSFYEYIWENCVNHGFRIGQDHLIPLCFLAGTKIPMQINGSKCTINCAGLIDSNYNLRYCNQYSEKLISLFNKDGSLISIDSIKKALNDYFIKLSNTVQYKGCEKCSLYQAYCNGGCFAAKDSIKTIAPII